MGETNWNRMIRVTEYVEQFLSDIPVTQDEIRQFVSKKMYVTHCDIRDAIMRLYSKGVAEYTKDMKVRLL
uniref:Uncharacterized protein n=1 Tax=viral metagenome TaxID=1070528 RepID=A0A6M3JVV4_9ZZZZ